MVHIYFERAVYLLRTGNRAFARENQSHLLLWRQDIVTPTVVVIEGISASPEPQIRPIAPMSRIVLTFVTGSGPVADLAMLTTCLDQTLLSPRIDRGCQVRIGIGNPPCGDHTCERSTLLSREALKR